MGLFAVEDGFLWAFAGAFGSAEGHAFFSLHLHHSCEALCLHLAFDGNYFAEMVDEERHRAVGVESAGGCIGHGGFGALGWRGLLRALGWCGLLWASSGCGLWLVDGD